MTDDLAARVASLEATMNALLTDPRTSLRANPTALAQMALETAVRAQTATLEALRQALDALPAAIAEAVKAHAAAE